MKASLMTARVQVNASSVVGVRSIFQAPGHLKWDLSEPAPQLPGSTLAVGTERRVVWAGDSEATAAWALALVYSFIRHLQVLLLTPGGRTGQRNLAAHLPRRNEQQNKEKISLWGLGL